MIAVPVPSTLLPGFDPLVNGSLWQQWAAEGRVFPLETFRAGVRYVRFKSAVSCRIAVFREGLPSDPPEGFLLYLFSELSRARMAFAKAVGRPRLDSPAGHEPFLCEAQAIVAVPYPNDAEIPALRHFHRSWRLRRALAEALPDFPDPDWRIKKHGLRRLLLTYKPGRRAVFRVDLSLKHRGGRLVELPLHVRVEDARQVALGAARIQAVRAAIPRGASWRVPALRSTAESRCLVVTDWVEGQGLTQLLPRRDYASALVATGRALAEFHELDSRAGRCRDGLDREELLGLAADLGELLPDEAARVAELGERLVARAAFLGRDAAALVHGDFHAGQVLIDRSGHPVLVDLDRSGSGHPLVDVGGMLAHLEESGAPQAAEPFLNGYRQVSGRAHDGERLRIATAAALFRRSIFPFRRLSPAWPSRITERLNRVEQLLEGTP